ncbi:ubiquitin-protein transferase [Aureococcus anophagefferens]|nr:ubiquitin-protein transferase [Aureococcus anophagefferens]
MCCDEEFNSPGDVLESKLRHIAQTGLEAREKILARKASKVAKSDGDPSRNAESAAAAKEALLDMLDDEEQEASKKQKKKAKKKAKKKGAAPVAAAAGARASARAGLSGGVLLSSLNLDRYGKNFAAAEVTLELLPLLSLDDADVGLSRQDGRSRWTSGSQARPSRRRPLVPRRRPPRAAARAAPPPARAPARPAPPPRDDDVPEEFLCPITFEIMTDPVIAADGHVRSAAIGRGSRAHVAGDERAPARHLIPAHTIRSLIQRRSEAS